MRSSRTESAIGRLVDDDEHKRAPEVATAALQDAERADGFEPRTTTGSAEPAMPSQSASPAEHATL